MIKKNIIDEVLSNQKRIQKKYEEVLDNNYELNNENDEFGRELLAKMITDTYVKKFLKYKFWNRLFPNEKRLEIDCDAYYYNNYTEYKNDKALFADTMVSIWMPLSNAIIKTFENATNNGLIYFAYGNKHVNMLKLIDAIVNQDEQIYERIASVFEKFENFTFLACTKGNFMILPNRGMQKRGGMIEDRIDKTLYECFENGVLSQYFSNITPKEWICREKLDSKYLFSDINNINKDSCKPFLSEYKKYAEMSLEELYQYLNIVVELIEERNTKLT